MAMNESRGLARQEPPQPGALAHADLEQAEAALLHYLGTGDLSKLTGEQRKALYKRTCDSLGINSLTRPFEWVEFYDPETKGKKLVLYPRSACADQLAYQHRIRIEVIDEKIVGTLFKVEMRGTLPNGRTETNVAYLDLTDRDGNQLRGQRLGNAYMKARTKAKRRLVFGMVGMMAPPDVEDLQQARVVTVDGGGNVIEAPTAEQKALAADPRMARVIGEPVFEDVDADAVLGPPTGADQQPDRASWEKPRREGPSPTFRADKAKWLRAWAAVVKDTYLEDDDARHGYVAMYTSTWPEGARTNSLSRLLSIITDVQASQFIEHTKNFLAERAAASAADPDGELDGIDGLTPQEADDVAAAQLGEHAYGDLTDEDLNARFESATTRVMGRPRAETDGPTRTAMIAELRQLVERAQAAGATIDLRDDIEQADAAELAASLETVRAAVQAAEVFA